jgi:hypothetical protein
LVRIYRHFVGAAWIVVQVVPSFYTESSGSKLAGKFRTFPGKRTERSGKFAAGTSHRMQEKFLTVYGRLRS